MKRMLSKILFAALVLGSMPMRADFKSGVRTVLQGIGNNSGKIALALMTALTGRIVWSIYQDQKKRDIDLMRRSGNALKNAHMRDALLPIFVPISIGTGGAVIYGLARFAGFLGSKI